MQEQVTLDYLVETSKQTAGVHAETYESQISELDNNFFGLKGVLSIGLFFQVSPISGCACCWDHWYSTVPFFSARSSKSTL